MLFRSHLREGPDTEADKSESQYSASPNFAMKRGIEWSWGKAGWPFGRSSRSSVSTFRFGHHSRASQRFGFGTVPRQGSSSVRFIPLGCDWTFGCLLRHCTEQVFPCVFVQKRTPNPVGFMGYFGPGSQNSSRESAFPRKIVYLVVNPILG